MSENVYHYRSTILTAWLIVRILTISQL